MMVIRLYLWKAHSPTEKTGKEWASTKALQALFTRENILKISFYYPELSVGVCLYVGMCTLVQVTKDVNGMDLLELEIKMVVTGQI